MREHRVARALAGMALATGGERVAPDAAREAGAPRIARDQPAVPAGKEHERHRFGGQARIAEVRLESQQIAARAAGCAALARDARAATSPARDDEHARAELLGLAARSLDAHEPALALLDARHHAPRLPQPRARARRGIEEQRVEVLAPDRASPLVRILGRGHRRVRRSSSPAIEPDALHRRPGARGKARPPRPAPRSSGHVVAEMYSPHTLRRGNSAFSTIATRSPPRASESAAVAPAGPPPITSASKGFTRLLRRTRG